MNSQDHTKAFLLRSVDYRDSDRIVTLLTENLGKISALAQGARRSQKRFGGALESFALIEVTVEARKGGMWRLAEARLVDSHMGLSQNLTRMTAAALIVELVREITPEHEPEPEIFHIVSESLNILNSADSLEIRAILIAALLKLLSAAGVGMSVDQCNVCGRQVPKGRKVLFHPARGGIVCTPCGGGPFTLEARTAEALMILFRLPLEQCRNVVLAPEDANMLEQTLTSFIDHHLEQPLRTHFIRP